MPNPEGSGAEEFLMVKKSARRTLRKHNLSLKAQRAVAATHFDKTVAKLSAQHELHSNRIMDWKRQLKA